MGDRPMPVTVDPFPLAALVLTSGVYVRGTLRIWGHVGQGTVVRRGQLVAWGLAVLSLVVAFAGPVEALAGEHLSVHMVQHVLLAVVAAPLVAMAAPLLPVLQGLPHRLRRPAARLHRRVQPLRSWTYTGGWPFAVVSLYAASTWLWHLPGPYQAAVHHDVVHAAEHATMLATGVLLWWTILQTARRSSFGYGTGILLVFFTALQHAGLGGLLSLSPTVLYPVVYAGGGSTFSALDDQQLAGMLMWAPSKFVHAVVVVLLALAWLRDVETRARRRETGAVSGP